MAGLATATVWVAVAAAMAGVGRRAAGRMVELAALAVHLVGAVAAVAAVTGMAISSTAIQGVGAGSRLQTICPCSEAAVPLPRRDRSA